MKKIRSHEQVYPGNTRGFKTVEKSINIICHINRLRRKTIFIILVNAEKEFGKIHTHS